MVFGWQASWAMHGSVHGYMAWCIGAWRGVTTVKNILQIITTSNENQPWWPSGLSCQVSNSSRDRCFGLRFQSSSGLRYWSLRVRNNLSLFKGFIAQRSNDYSYKHLKWVRGIHSHQVRPNPGGPKASVPAAEKMVKRKRKTISKRLKVPKILQECKISTPFCFHISTVLCFK